MSEFVRSMREVQDAQMSSLNKRRCQVRVKYFPYWDIYRWDVCFCVSWAGGMMAKAPRSHCNLLARYGRELGIAWHLTEELAHMDSNNLSALEDQLIGSTILFGSIGDRRGWRCSIYLESSIQRRTSSGTTMDSVQSTTSLALTRQKVVEHVWSARRILRDLPQSSHRDHLDHLAHALAKYCYVIAWTGGVFWMDFSKLENGGFAKEPHAVLDYVGPVGLCYDAVLVWVPEATRVRECRLYSGHSVSDNVLEHVKSWWVSNHRPKFSCIRCDTNPWQVLYSRNQLVSDHSRYKIELRFWNPRLIQDHLDLPRLQTDMFPLRVANLLAWAIRIESSWDSGLLKSILVSSIPYSVLSDFSCSSNVQRSIQALPDPASKNRFRVAFVEVVLESQMQSGL